MSKTVTKNNFHCESVHMVCSKQPPFARTCLTPSTPLLNSRFIDKVFVRTAELNQPLFQLSKAVDVYIVNTLRAAWSNMHGRLFLIANWIGVRAVPRPQIQRHLSTQQFDSFTSADERKRLLDLTCFMSFFLISVCIHVFVPLSMTVSDL